MENQGMGSHSEPFFELLQPATPPVAHASGSGSSSYAQNGPRRSDSSPGFSFSTDDVLPNYDFQPIRSSNGGPRIEEAGTSKFRHSPPSYDPPQVRDPPITYEKYESTRPRHEFDKDAYDSATAATVERTMKKYADNLLRVLEGISGRLSQLEATTQRLEVSLDKVKNSTANNHGEVDGRLRMLENMVREVQRGVQVLRDKQEINEAQLQLKLRQEKIEVPKTEQPPVVASAPPQQTVIHQAPLEPKPAETTVTPVIPPQPPQPAQVSQVPLQPSQVPHVPPQPPHVSQPSYGAYPPQQLNQPQAPPMQPQAPPMQPQAPPMQPQAPPMPPQAPPLPPQAPLMHPQAPPMTPQAPPLPPQAPPQPPLQQVYSHQPEAPPYPHHAQAPPQYGLEIPPTYMPPSYGQRPHQQGPAHQIYERPGSSGAYEGRTSGPLALPPPPYAAQQQYEPGYGGSPGSYRYPHIPTAQPVQKNEYSGRSQGRSGVDEVIDKVAVMGFPREQVRATVQRLTENGQAVDMNVVLDKLMNGGESSSVSQPAPKGWFGR